MYCRKCGSQLSEQDKFCVNCGEVVNPNTEVNNSVPQNLESQPTQTKKSFPKWIIIVIVVIAIIICGVVTLTVLGVKKEYDTIKKVDSTIKDMLKDDANANANDNSNTTTNNSSVSGAWVNDPILEDGYTVEKGATLKVRGINALTGTKPGNDNDYDIKVTNIEYGTFGNGTYDYMIITVSGTVYQKPYGPMLELKTEDNQLFDSLVLKTIDISLYSKLTDADKKVIEETRKYERLEDIAPGEFTTKLLYIGIKKDYKNQKLKLSFTMYNQAYVSSHAYIKLY